MDVGIDDVTRDARSAPSNSSLSLSSPLLVGAGTGTELGIDVNWMATEAAIISSVNISNINVILPSLKSLKFSDHATIGLPEGREIFTDAHQINSRRDPALPVTRTSFKAFASAVFASSFSLFHDEK
jgi:hypothetical protein